MDNLPGKLLTVYLLATLLAAGAGAWLVHRYRAALPALMRAPLDAAAPSDIDAGHRSSPGAAAAAVADAGAVAARRVAPRRRRCSRCRR